MQIKIYHNPDCTKSCSALEVLKHSSADVTIINYLEQPLSVKELTEIVEMLGIPADELIRKNEPEFSPYLNIDLTQDDCIKLILKYPVLLQRPIVVKGNKAIIMRPPVMLDDLIEIVKSDQ